MIYSLKDLRRDKQKQEIFKEAGHRPDDLLYDEQGNIRTYDVYQRLLRKKENEDK